MTPATKTHRDARQDTSISKMLPVGNKSIQIDVIISTHPGEAWMGVKIYLSSTKAG